MLSEWGTLRGRSTSAFSTLKTTALAPMASASVSTAVAANPGDLRNWRMAIRRSAFMTAPFLFADVRAWDRLGNGPYGTTLRHGSGFPKGHQFSLQNCFRKRLHLQNRRGETKSMEWAVEPVVTRSARISPMTGANLNP